MTMQPQCHASSGFPRPGPAAVEVRGLQPRLVLAGVALAANALQLAGVYWDVGWHHARGRETFWSPPHMAIYAGVALALATAAVGLRGGWRGGGAYRVAALGPMIQAAAAPVDELWHRAIGPDVSIWSPPHLLGILGGMVGVLGWVRVLVGRRAAGVPDRGARGLACAFTVLLLAGALFALGEYDHDQASREAGLYPALVGILAPWILVAARAWLGWAWAGTLVAIGYALVRLALAVAVWGIGLPWMGIPPLIVPGAILLDLLAGRRGPGAAGAVFGLAFTVFDYPLTYLVSGRAWGVFEWAGSLLPAAAAGWASARLGRWLAAGRKPWEPPSAG